MNRLPRMTVVVSEVSYPNLYALLKGEQNDRARAALLKRLAEDGARLAATDTNSGLAASLRLGHESTPTLPSLQHDVPTAADLDQWFK